MKNAQNHQYNNIHQYIAQIKAEKQELQSQLVELVANADAKRLEIERLHKELKQLKEKLKQHAKEKQLEKEQKLIDADLHQSHGEKQEGLKDVIVDDVDSSTKSSNINKDDSLLDNASTVANAVEEKRPTSSVSATGSGVGQLGDSASSGGEFIFLFSSMIQIHLFHFFRFMPI
mgnify:CR=1 FL=1